jgi:hypothetical protein
MTESMVKEIAVLLARHDYRFGMGGNDESAYAFANAHKFEKRAAEILELIGVAAAPPSEPTKEMALAGRKALAVVADRMEEAKLLATSSIDFWQRVGHEPANEIYKAMIAVAPPSGSAVAMREALEPFANLANGYDDDIDSDDRPVGPVALKFCRSARAALAAPQAQEGDGK